jgi:hypothetical protein
MLPDFNLVGREVPTPHTLLTASVHWTALDWMRRWRLLIGTIVRELSVSLSAERSCMSMEHRRSRQGLGQIHDAASNCFYMQLLY